MTVNRTEGEGRRKADIKSVRAVFRELDYEAFKPGLPPSVIVETSPGKSHEWYFVDGLSLDDFDAVQRHLVDTWQSDPNAKDRSRVLRLPGFFHMKGDPFMVRVTAGSGTRYTTDQIKEAFPPVYHSGTAPSIEGDMKFTPATLALVNSWVAAMPGDKVESRDAWLRFGVALARLGDDWFDENSNDLRLDLWRRLSEKAPSYGQSETGCDEKWDDRLEAAAQPCIRKATYKTLLYAAREGGWTWDTCGLTPDHKSEARIILGGLQDLLEGIEDLDGPFTGAADTGAERSEDDKAAGNAAPRKMRAESFKDAIKKALSDTSRPLIKGLLDEGAMSVIYGDSNTGKTFTTLDQAFCVATGQAWNGMRTKQGLVVFVAAEGGRTILRRLAALHGRYIGQHGDDAPDPLFSVVRYPIDLRTNEVDRRGIVELIQEEERKHGTKCVWLIVDTLSRAMAGGDENSSTDMGSVVIAADKIRAATGVHFTYIHHSGKDSARGARGHSLLRAAADTEIEVTRTKIEVTKQRDMESGVKIGFRLVDVPLALDPEGAPIKSAVVEWEPIEGASEAVEQAAANNADVRLLCAIRDIPHGKQVEWARASGLKAGSISKRLAKLKTEKLVDGAKGRSWLTPRGTKVAARVEQPAAVQVEWEQDIDCTLPNWRSIKDDTASRTTRISTPQARFPVRFFGSWRPAPNTLPTTIFAKSSWRFL